MKKLPLLIQINVQVLAFLFLFTLQTNLFSEEPQTAGYEICWEKVRDNAPWGPRHRIGAVIFKDRMWVIAGAYYDSSRQEHLYSDVWSSEDGENWTLEIEATAFGARAGHTAFVLNDKIYVFGGYTIDQNNHVFCDATLWSSDDGLDWSVEVPSSVPNAPAAGFDYDPVVFNGSLYLFGAKDIESEFVNYIAEESGGGNPGEIWRNASFDYYRFDGEEWEYLGEISNWNNIVKASAFRDGICQISSTYCCLWSVIYGLDNDGDLTDITPLMTGDDGKAYPAGNELITYAGRLWLIGGVVNEWGLGEGYTIDMVHMPRSYDGIVWNNLTSCNQSDFVMITGALFSMTGSGPSAGWLQGRIIQAIRPRSHLAMLLLCRQRAVQNLRIFL